MSNPIENEGDFAVEAELHLKKEWNGEKLNQFMSSISDMAAVCDPRMNCWLRSPPKVAPG